MSTSIQPELTPARELVSQGNVRVEIMEFDDSEIATETLAETSEPSKTSFTPEPPAAPTIDLSAYLAGLSLTDVLDARITLQPPVPPSTTSTMVVQLPPRSAVERARALELQATRSAA